MAILLDGSTDKIVYAGAAPPHTGATYTWMGWVRTSADVTTQQAIFSVNDGDWREQDLILLASSGGWKWSTFVSISSANTFSYGSTVAAGDTWYHLAMVRTSDTALDLYVNGAFDNTNARDVTGRTSSTQIELGTYEAGSSLFEGAIAAEKIWTTDLSAAQIASEMRTYAPQNLASIWAWYPHFSGATPRLRDNGGDARDWTVGAGTPTDRDGPPILWGALSPQTAISGGGTPPAGNNLAWKLASSRPSLAGVGGLAG